LPKRRPVQTLLRRHAAASARAIVPTFCMGADRYPDRCFDNHWTMALAGTDLLDRSSRPRRRPPTAGHAWTLEITSHVAAPRLFLAAVMEWAGHTLAAWPQISPPTLIANAHIVQGDSPRRQSQAGQVHFWTTGRALFRRSTYSPRTPAAATCARRAGPGCRLLVLEHARRGAAARELFFRLRLSYLTEWATVRELSCDMICNHQSECPMRNSSRPCAARRAQTK